jgi:hypothetical protein
MDCKKVRGKLAAYCDGALSRDEGQQVRLHLETCRNCVSLSEQFTRLRATLRALPALSPPAQLTAALDLLASEESARKLSGGNWHWLLGGRMPRARFWLSEMVRPIAVPMAGGLVSALVLFAVLAPSFAPHTNPRVADVPTTLSTSALFLGMGPFGFSGDMVVTLDVTVDGAGRLVDYSAVDGQAWANDPGMRRSVENALLFTHFSPGTRFGRPALAKVRITLSRTQIDIRG